MIKGILAFILIVLAAGCSPNSLEDFQHEGEAMNRALAKDIREIRTREELVKAIPRLKKRYEEFVDLIIAAKEYQQEHLEEEPPEVNFSDLPNGELLFWELKRIYAMEGGRESMEKAQREALIRLDAYERNRAKQNQILHKH
jgi:hypothetical protein